MRVSIRTTPRWCQASFQEMVSKLATGEHKQWDRLFLCCVICLQPLGTILIKGKKHFLSCTVQDGEESKIPIKTRWWKHHKFHQHAYRRNIKCNPITFLSSFCYKRVYLIKKLGLQKNFFLSPPTPQKDRGMRHLSPCLSWYTNSNSKSHLEKETRKQDTVDIANFLHHTKYMVANQKPWFWKAELHAPFKITSAKIHSSLASEVPLQAAAFACFFSSPSPTLISEHNCMADLDQALKTILM